MRKDTGKIHQEGIARGVGRTVLRRVLSPCLGGAWVVVAAVVDSMDTRR